MAQESLGIKYSHRSHHLIAFVEQMSTLKLCLKIRDSFMTHQDDVLCLSELDGTIDLEYGLRNSYHNKSASAQRNSRDSHAQRSEAGRRVALLSL